MSIARLMQAAASNAGAGPEGWDIDRAYGENTWPIGVSGLYYTGRSGSMGTGLPSATQISPDGTKLLVMDQNSDRVEEFSLGTPYKIDTISAQIRSYVVTAQTTVPFGLWISPDGTRMAHGRSGAGNIYQYTLNTPWSLSSVTYLGTAIPPSIPFVEDLEFSPDGTKLVCLDGNSTNLREYTLGTAFDVSTATLVRSRDVGSAESGPRGISFNADGTSLFLTGTSGDDINQYGTATPYSLFAFTGPGTFSVSAQVLNPVDVIAMSSTYGLYAVGSNNVYEYSNLFPRSFATTAQETLPTGLFITPDGDQLFIIGTQGNSVDRYTLSTPWVIHTGVTYVSTRSINLQETAPQDLFFSPDGTKMFVTGLTGQDVNQYTLSTAWNPLTVTFNGVFSVASQETAPTGLYFSPDGLRMFVCGTASDAVQQYSLTTPWEITSGVSFVRSFSVSSQEATPTGLSFKPDGKRMYVCGSAGDDINEYHMTTPWDISTASLVATSNIFPSLVGLRGMFFRQDDGTSLYFAGAQPRNPVSFTGYIQVAYIDPE